MRRFFSEKILTMYCCCNKNDPTVSERPKLKNTAPQHSNTDQKARLKFFFSWIATLCLICDTFPSLRFPYFATTCQPFQLQVPTPCLFSWHIHFRSKIIFNLIQVLFFISAENYSITYIYLLSNIDFPGNYQKKNIWNLFFPALSLCIQKLYPNFQFWSVIQFVPNFANYNFWKFLFKKFHVKLTKS